MTLLHVYLECLTNTFKAVRSHPWVVLLPFGYGVAMMLGAILFGPLGMAGGFLMGLLMAALMSSALYYVGELVAGQRVTVGELKKSLIQFFWSVIAVRFVLWIVDLVVEPGLRTLENGHALVLVLNFALFILLNAVPEIIYQRGTITGMQPILESLEFVQKHWIEWFIPNLALGAALYFGLPLLRLTGLPFAEFLLVPMALFPIMIFRGNLFRLLTSYTPRALEMRYKNR